MNKLFIDCTFTRAHPANIGITRVVRKLAEELDSSRFDHNIELVGFSHEGFRTVPPMGAIGNNTAPPQYNAQKHNLLAYLFLAATSQRLRNLVRKSLPLGIQAWLWRVISAATYGGLTKSYPLANPVGGDIVLLCDASWNYAVGECAKQAKAQGARIVTLIYDLIPHTHPQYCAPLFSLVFRRWLDEAIEFSDAIVCISETTKQSIIKYCSQNKITHPPIRAFHLGSNFSNTTPMPQSIRRPILDVIPGKQNPPTFLSVGSIEPRKKYDFILDAFDIIWKAGSQIRWILAGRPAHESEKFIERIKRHPLNGNLLFYFADASDSEIDFFYRHADALIFASAAEGFGLPLVEARERGCRVMASDIPVFREIGDEGVTYFGLDQPELLSKAITEHVKNKDGISPPDYIPFRWSDSADQLMNAIRSCLCLQLTENTCPVNE